MIEVKSLVLGIVGTNCYIVYDENKKEAVLIDPAAEEERIISFLEGANLKPKAILLTHGHFDHILAVPALREKYQIPLYAAEEEREMLGNGQYNMSGRDPEERVEIHDFIGLHDGDRLELLGRKWKVLSTPGHTKGSVCFFVEGNPPYLFSGDTLFRNPTAEPICLAEVRGILSKVFGKSCSPFLKRRWFFRDMRRARQFGMRRAIIR